MIDYANLPFPGVKVEYPTKPKRDPIIGSLTVQELVDIYPLLMKYQEDFDAYQAQKAAYRQYVRDYEAFFKQILEIENGVVCHPKADLIYSRAWNMGHSSGYNAVAAYYNDLVELIK